MFAKVSSINFKKLITFLCFKNQRKLSLHMWCHHKYLRIAKSWRHWIRIIHQIFLQSKDWVLWVLSVSRVSREC